MKKIISTILIAVTLLSTSAMADCDYSKIVKNVDGSYTYSKELHICVGEMKRDLDAATVQLGEYKKVIELKDLALTKANERADLWMNTSFKLQDRMNTIDELKSKNQYLAFGLGIVLTSLAVYGAGQLAHR